MPPSSDSGFDSLSRSGLEKLGMDPGFIADYENYEALLGSFDFTKVDTTFRKNLVDTAGKISSKKAFEEAGKVVDRGLEVMAGVLGATGQWYGTAAAILSEEALDWAESKFENYMGWEEDSEPIKGHWVLIDEGTRRRRLPGELFANETSGKNPLVRSLVAAYADANPHDGYVHLVDQNMRERNEPVEKLRRVTAKIEAELEASPAGSRMKDLIMHHHHGLHRPVIDQVKGKVGQHVTIDGELFTVTQGSTVSRVQAERDGRLVSRPWADPAVQGAWNANNGASTFRSGPGNWLQDDFVQAGEFHRGEWVWGGNELFVIVAIKGNELASMWSAWDGRSVDEEPDKLAHFDDGESLPRIFRHFRTAALEGDVTKALASLPSRSYPDLVSQMGAKPDAKFVPRQTRGQHETPFKGGGHTSFYDTNREAKRIDADRERYNKQASAWPNQPPPDKYSQAWETTSVMSEDSWGPAQWDRANPPETSGVTFLPIVLLGLAAAFALTR